MANPSDVPARERLPVLPLRDVVVFPHMVVPLFVGRRRSVAALEEAFTRPGKDIVLVAQINARTNEPGAEDLYAVGCVGTIGHVLRLPDGTVKISVEGLRRAHVERIVVDEPFLVADVAPLEHVEDDAPTDEQLLEAVTQLRAAFEQYARINRRIPAEIASSVASIEDPSQLADTIAAHTGLKVAERQQLLGIAPVYGRIGKLLKLIEAETEVANVERKIRKKVGAQEQGSAEGGAEADEFKSELEELKREIDGKDLPDEARQRLEREFRKVKMMNPMSAEAGVVRTYIDWVLSLPWHDISEDVLDIPKAQGILDADHYGLVKPKERIVEYLAVQKLTGKVGKGPILCLVGPPGVGKTSLAKSVARATGRKFVRLSLGGVRDEAEIRGHRRTYVGALPGKIIHALKKAGTSNPVILLDEIDKMSQDFRGDPASALLEVLDPEQNTEFNDHYIDLDYDLSKALFITTANFLNAIPIPLADRLEIIELGGYTEMDKLQIAKQYLVPRQLEDNGVQDLGVKFSDDTLKILVRDYTREAGVRSLERQIGACCRKIATEHLSEKKAKKRNRVTEARVRKFLGTARYRDTGGETQPRIGVVNGLAVTAYGGDLLLAETTMLPGKGKLSFTGKLGDVMQESVQAAMSYVRSRAHHLGLGKEFYSKIDVHVHFPEGAIPKDGPSAGVAIATGLVSVLTQIPVRHDVAMTGEITLRGRVLPIGGLKEKCIAAHRAGMKKVLAPRENERNLEDIPKEIAKDLEIVFVEHIDEALREALVLDAPAEFLRDGGAVSRNYLGIYDDPTPAAAVTH
jgi:ATP-dependent Lon protease